LIYSGLGEPFRFLARVQGEIETVDQPEYRKTCLALSVETFGGSKEKTWQGSPSMCGSGQVFLG
jgi:hypothetical protein